jgi:hypothetical protein
VTLIQDSDRPKSNTSHQKLIINRFKHFECTNGVKITQQQALVDPTEDFTKIITNLFVQTIKTNKFNMIYTNPTVYFLSSWYPLYYIILLYIILILISINKYYY